MVGIHELIGTMGLIYTLVLGLWGLVLFFRAQPPTSSYIGALWIATGIFGLQTLVGVILWLLGGQPREWIHYLYGVLAALSTPLAFTITRNRPDRRSSLIYAFFLLFVFVIAIRAYMTAS